MPTFLDARIEIHDFWPRGDTQRPGAFSQRFGDQVLTLQRSGIHESSRSGRTSSGYTSTGRTSARHTADGDSPSASRWTYKIRTTPLFAAIRGFVQPVALRRTRHTALFQGPALLGGSIRIRVLAPVSGHNRAQRPLAAARGRLRGIACITGFAGIACIVR